MSDLLSLDPKGTAEKLAKYDVMAQSTLIQNQQKQLIAQKNALNSLKTTLTDFRTALLNLNKTDSGMVQNSAKLSNDNIASVKVTSNAISANYSFHVDRLASAHQVALQDMTDTDVANDNGILSLKIGDKQLDIDMSKVSSMSELVNVINSQSDNPGLTASMVRTNGQVVLMLGSNESGAANKIEISGSSSLLASATQKELSQAVDAEVWLGAKDTGVLMTNSSNTFTNLMDGVTIEFKQVQAENDAPLTVSVGMDNSATKDQVNKFIDAYNTLMAQLDSLTQRGGPLPGDSGIKTLKSQMNSMVRESFGGYQMTDFGILADREGKLTLDSTQLDNILKATPTALSTLFNGTDGLLKSLDNGLNGFLSLTTGQIKSRQDTLNRRESQLSERAANIEVRYNNAYNRYLKQFSQLQKVLGQMNSTLDMFNNMASSMNNNMGKSTS